MRQKKIIFDNQRTVRNTDLVSEMLTQIGLKIDIILLCTWVLKLKYLFKLTLKFKLCISIWSNEYVLTLHYIYLKN